MLSPSVISEAAQAISRLRSELNQNRIAYLTADSETDTRQLAAQPPDLVLVLLDNSPDTLELIHRIKQGIPVPVMALVSGEIITTINDTFPVDDFIISPYNHGEFTLRAKRLINKSGSSKKGVIIRCGDLLIDPVKCEVTLGGKVVMLTFKEYELLKFLASNPDRVFNRETLLNSVWGYDYYGGDRTVDVHIRRLRSKIEDYGHTFINTIRNIGYQFKTDD